MKIAFCNRKEYNSPLGGDGVQMLKTKYYLEENYSLDISIITNPNDLNSSYDIVHIFNYLTISETFEFFKKSISLNLIIVSSSIYWDYSYSSTHIFSKLFWTPNFISERRLSIQRALIRVIANITNIPIGISPKFKKYCLLFMNSSKFILPNSLEEGENLIKFAGNLGNEYFNKIRVIYNATDFSINDIHGKLENKRNLFLSKYGIPDGYILQVGRIEYLKNQLNLIVALNKHKEIPIVFVGKILEKKYFNKVQKLAKQRGNVYFIEQVDHKDIQDFYKYAKVHVLLSLRESPGLVSIEANSMGCPIVVSDERFTPVNTYFKESAYIANPLNKESIRKAVLDAYILGNKASFKNEFTWNVAAEQTYNVYLECINQC